MRNDLVDATRKLADHIDLVQDMINGLDYLAKHHQRPAKPSDVSMQWIAQQIATLQRATEAGVNGAQQTYDRYRNLEAAMYEAQRMSVQQYTNIL